MAIDACARLMASVRRSAGVRGSEGARVERRVRSGFGADCRVSEIGQPEVFAIDVDPVGAFWAV